MFVLQANIKEVSVDVPHKLHNSIIGAKGRLIRSIMEECGGVIIRFPAEGSTSDKVTIRGPAEDVDKAKKQLLELANQIVSLHQRMDRQTDDRHMRPSDNTCIEVNPFYRKVTLHKLKHQLCHNHKIQKSNAK